MLKHRICNHQSLQSSKSWLAEKQGQWKISLVKASSHLFSLWIIKFSLVINLFIIFLRPEQPEASTASWDYETLLVLSGANNLSTNHSHKPNPSVKYPMAQYRKHPTGVVNMTYGHVDPSDVQDITNCQWAFVTMLTNRLILAKYVI